MASNLTEEPEDQSYDSLAALMQQQQDSPTTARFSVTGFLGLHSHSPKADTDKFLNGVDSNDDLTTPRLMALVASILGAQLVWSVEFAYGTPILISLGLSKQASSLVWIAGPCTGLLCQPVIGALSDKTTHRYRRRKYIILSTIALACSALSVAYCKPLATFFVSLFLESKGDWDPRLVQVARTVSIYICISAFWLLDFSLNALQASSRALILDTATGPQQTLANAWQGRVSQVGNVIGYGLGFTNLSRSKAVSWIPGGQAARLFVISVILCGLFTAVTCYFIEETSLQDEDDAAEQEEIQMIDLFRNIRQSMVDLPPGIRKLCYVQFFSWIGWFPFLFFATVYVSEQSQHETHKSNEAATRDGSLAMLYYALVALCAGCVLPFVVRLGTWKSTRSLPQWANPLRSALTHLTLRNFWTASHILFGILMFSTSFISSLSASMTVVALAGISWAVTSWVPYALVMEMIRDTKDDLSCDTCRPKDSTTYAALKTGRQAAAAAIEECAPLLGREEQRLSGATVLGIHNLAIVAPQFITSLLASIILKLTAHKSPNNDAGTNRDISWVFMVGAISAFVAAWMVRSIPQGSYERQFVRGLKDANDREARTQYPNA